MKIANIILTSQNGGAEQVFIDYMILLKRIGHEVLAIVKHDAPYADKISKLGIPVKKIRNDLGYHDFLAIKNLKKILTEFQSDITISHMGRAAVLVRKAINKIPEKQIFEVCVNHSMNVKRSIGANMILSVNRQIFYRTIDLGQSETTSFAVSNAVDFNCDGKILPQIALQNKKEITLGVMGRTDATKGFQHAIAMMKLLEKNSEKKFLLKIAGNGYYKPKLEELAAKLNVTSQIQFLDWIENKKDFFTSLDVFLMTSEEETFGLVLLEAMKYCVPIISTNSDGAKEILRDKIDAKVIEIAPTNSIDTRLAQSVMEMISDDEKANQMVHSAFNRLRQKFTYNALEKTLRELLGNPTK